MLARREKLSASSYKLLKKINRKKRAQDNSKMPDSQSIVDDLHNKRVERVTVKLPAFNSNDPELWFLMVEVSFAAAKVTDVFEKLGHVLSALEPKHAEEMRDILAGPMDAEIYTKFKSELIKRLSISEEKKISRLLENEEIGDRKPSQFLRHLKNLAGQNAPDSWLRTLFLKQLPHSTQAILATMKDLELDKNRRVGRPNCRPTANEATSLLHHRDRRTKLNCRGSQSTFIK